MSKFKLFLDNNSFYIQPLNTGKTLKIDRFNKRLEVKLMQEKPTENILIDGIIGILEAPSSSYLIVISESRQVGKILNSEISQIKSVSYIPFANSKEKSYEDSKYIQFYDDFLSRNTLYYSDTYDLTNSVKNQFSKYSKKDQSAYFSELRIDFCWNYMMIKNICITEAEGFVFPVINGFVSITEVTSYNKEFKFVLISRKDTRRVGVRYLVRGADSNGNTSNFVETEEILVNEENSLVNIVSYLQIRGSIPLIWTQNPDISYTPKIKIVNNIAMQQNVFKRHLSDINSKYGKIVLVNLIDKKKDQKMIGEAFQRVSEDQKESTNNWEYVWFDFHEECKRMKYENLSRLLRISKVNDAIRSFDYTHVLLPNNFVFNNYKSKEHQVRFLQEQMGVFRVNCIDCLDRTNVVQTVFARQILHKILYKLKISGIPKGEVFDPFHESFEPIFKGIWADNGDALSFSYSGTKAMKGDFTRKGKKTIKGSIMDGVYSLTRYFINNFRDGYNQDTIDFSLCKINHKSGIKPHRSSVLPLTFAVLIILIFILYNLALSIALPKEYEDSSRKQILRFLIFIGISYISTQTLFSNIRGRLVDVPTYQHN